MTVDRIQITASILDADLASLADECRRALRAGADRLHLDSMDGHFVPNITFGPTVIKRLRPVGKQPFDAHLMISEPGRYMDQYIEAGCDTISFHVEVEEPIEPTLLKIRKAGRKAGLAIKPATPLSALEPYRELLDIVMIMTVEPGFGGQKFIYDAGRKIGPAHDYLADRSTGQVHVDGGVNRGTVEFCGALAAEVVVAGSILWKPGVDVVHEIRLLKALGDLGYAAGAGAGKPAAPHGEWLRFATLPAPVARRLARNAEAAGIPAVVIAADRATVPAPAPRALEVLIPADHEKGATARFGEELAAAAGAIS
jgi:ribulose-phosphate 3-epimerase